ncbi:Protein-glutamate methylesterase/protein-glutamine glutaminase [Caballeronia sp. SBC1]|uniref:diguanylate cyclase domain-containing protein n=1 Tax=unclassified Caballeronia TaxID=2646786 RepID=UPI0013E1F57A|nr:MULTISPECIES: diguanylate cyclase [unclassified Caballeronia]QIE24142.1 Protein-glutamate methylesterase/protein-glutamine glutaminase [Caballeronia sp. SBC2]QIN62038.1 Protein-glutamate methylesterase/protein-glutamine glutaminase [Caballeronia sp. SBC1]
MEHILESWLLHANRRPKILIADDQPTNIRVLYELFRDQCDVFMATTGAQTMQICRAELPDLILLDVVMEDIDGHEVCRRLKADSLTGAIPIIFVTSQNQEADEVIALGLGAVDFITKPINPVIVRARVRTHLTLKLQGDLLRASALLDGLTGVANRRKFDEDVQTDWRQCLRESAPLSLILIDIDYFKLYNDRYGHQAGDNCLKLVARALFDALRRPYDKLARYGGEEFACLLPKTELAGASAMAQRMQTRVSELNVEHLGSDVDQVVTISLGVASMVPTPSVTPELLLKAADQQLYEAKRTGRARVCTLTTS